jgi:hypothetical protein
MGGVPYFYFVKHQRDVDNALRDLRQREFDAGRYFPVVMFPFEASSESPGRKHETIEDALNASGEDGTRSILDIDAITEESSFGAATRVAEDELVRIYGTATPTREQLERNMSFLDELERGHAVYVVAYKDGAPHEILFAGYSYD